MNSEFSSSDQQPAQFAAARSPDSQPTNSSILVAASRNVEPMTYTVAETAIVVGVSKASIYRLLRRRILKPVQKFRYKLISRRKVHDFVNGGRRD